MKLVLTGEAELRLQERLGALVAEASGAGQSKQEIDLRKIPAEEVAQKLGEQSLFGAANLWVVLGWQSLRSPKQADALLAQFAAQPDSVIIVVPDRLTPAKKKKLLAPWKIESFDPPANVFTFLENIRVKPLNQIWNLYLQALESSGEWGVHALVARQAWMLLQYQTGDAAVAANPWLAKKLATQAKHFPQAEVLTFINDLYQIELGIKSGKNKLPWREQFDVALTKLYAHDVDGTAQL